MIKLNVSSPDNEEWPEGQDMHSVSLPRSIQVSVA
jgi:hypothetical protein